ncbi:MAG: hypothetical protein NXH95_12710 [Pseudomonadaceae bacterium]|nr:hypothetical protein [Pseudomonadaceae bacterium]
MENLDQNKLTVACDWVMELPFEMANRGIPLLMSPALMAALLRFAYARDDLLRMCDCVEMVLEFEERQPDELGAERFLACCCAAYDHDPDNGGEVVVLADFLQRRNSTTDNTPSA